MEGSFCDVVLRKKKLPADAQLLLKQVYGELRACLKDFTMQMNDLRPHIEKILGRVAQLQDTTYSGVAWKEHWKRVSHQGFDICSGRLTDYGNVEYYVLIGCFCRWSPHCFQCMERLADYFPSLHPDAALTDRACEMQGDVLEICMAAMRGHREFSDVLPASGLPVLFNKLCSVCRAIHYLDACLRTGKLKSQNVEGIALLTTHWPELASHAFVQDWLLGVRTRQRALLSLVLAPHD